MVEMVAEESSRKCEDKRTKFVLHKEPYLLKLYQASSGAAFHFVELICNRDCLSILVTLPQSQKQ